MEVTGKIKAEHNPSAEASKKIEELKKKLPAQTQQPQTKKRKFEIEVYDEIQVGENIDNIQLQKVVMERPVIIEAGSKKELDDIAAKFKLCKQRMKIVRVLDDDGNAVPLKQAFAQQAQAPTQVQQQVPQVQTVVQQASVIKQKPRFYSVGGIEIKDDNGKIYQKQWMKLSEKEAQNFRLVNDANNKIASMNGKHLEMKRWVAVETSNEDDGLENELGEEQ